MTNYRREATALGLALCWLALTVNAHDGKTSPTSNLVQVSTTTIGLRGLDRPSLSPLPAVQFFRQRGQVLETHLFLSSPGGMRLHLSGTVTGPHWATVQRLVDDSSGWWIQLEGAGEPFETATLLEALAREDAFRIGDEKDFSVRWANGGSIHRRVRAESSGFRTLGAELSASAEGGRFLAAMPPKLDEALAFLDGAVGLEGEMEPATWPPLPAEWRSLIEVLRGARPDLFDSSRDASETASLWRIEYRTLHKGIHVGQALAEEISQYSSLPEWIRRGLRQSSSEDQRQR